MQLNTIPYTGYNTNLPKTGQHIVGQIQNGNIVVYQAFNPAIATYAVQHQKFGGAAYSFNRMSWIKPNFLWMMYRAGWATKPNQERILAIEISLEHFEIILEKAVYSAFQADIYDTETNWKAALDRSDVRLQWDPDHNAFGTKQMRRAIQIGMKGDILRQFCTEWVVSIQDITNFVVEQGVFVEKKEAERIIVMQEAVITIKNEEIVRKLKIDAV
jgi:glutamyl/glutaminyl-tRNA synthetase